MLTSNDLKNKLTMDDIIKLCCHLQGDENYLIDAQGHPIFSTYLCHGGDSLKLYYYPETQLFYCFTCGSSYDVFELVRRAVKLETFKEAFDYVVDFFNFKETGFNEEKKVDLISDWDIFQQIEDFEVLSQNNDFIQDIPENLLEYFYSSATPYEWLQDGISAEVMAYYGIRVDSALHKIIIPHRDINGKLIGIRGRSFNPIEVANGNKYMPVSIENTMYRHSLGKNLFGLYENQNTIRKLKKVLICESEKAVMQAASFYGVDNCFVVATSGSNLSQAQIDLIMSLGVEEVILGYDKEYQGTRGEKDEVKYEAKLLKIIQPLAQYFNTYIIMDFDNLLGYKDSPTDKGKETLEKLMKKKIYISPIQRKIQKKER